MEMGKKSNVKLSSIVVCVMEKKYIACLISVYHVKCKAYGMRNMETRHRIYDVKKENVIFYRHF